MLVRDSELYLYHLALKRQSNYIHSCTGHFIDEVNSVAVKEARPARRVKDLQLCIATETHLELYDVSEGSLKKLATIDIFATITCMRSFHAENHANSFLAITSDSGNLSIVRFERRVRVDDGDDSIILRTLMNEPLSRSGIRRLSPISRIEVDLYGRCLFLSAIEKNKLCFVLNTNNDDRTLAIQSPLEANRPNMLTLDTAACDVQYENPCFASIEIDTADNNEVHLVFYVLDLGLNHIVKRADFKIETSANFIMGLPSLSKYGISSLNSATKESAYDEDDINPFVLIGFDDYILVKDMNGFYNLKVQIPKRKSQLKLKVSIIAHALQTLKKDFFVLLQSNTGDLFKFKVFPEKSDGNRPQISISYFDSIPLAESLHIFKNGYLFANSEYCHNYLFQFESLGEEEERTGNVVTSLEPTKKLNLEQSDTLRNLRVVQKMKNLNPLLSGGALSSSPLTISTCSSDNPSFYVNGVNFNHVISSQLPGGAKSIWTVRMPAEKYHKLLFISYPKSTMILRIEDGSIEELSTTGNPFRLKGDSTVLVHSIGKRSIIQVCENEVRQIIFNDENQLSSCKLEWFPPAGIKVVSAACTQYQLAIGLSNGEIVYFEMDRLLPEDSLHELQNRIEVDEIITSMSMLSGLRSDWLAVGSEQSTVKIFSLKSSNADEFLEVLALQTFAAPVNDVKLISNEQNIELHAGLQNGMYCSSKVNSRDGEIVDIKTKLLGIDPVSISLLDSIFFDDLVAGLGEEEEEEEEDDNDDGEINKQERMKEEWDTGTLKSCLVLHSSKTWVSYNLESLLYVRPVINRTNNPILTKVTNFTAANVKLNGYCALNASGALIIGKLTDIVTRQNWFQDYELALSGDKEEDQEEDESDLEDEEEGSTLKVPAYRTKKIIKIADSKGLMIYVQNSINENRTRVIITKGEKVCSADTTKESFQLLENIRTATACITKFSTNVNHLVIASTGGKLYTYILHTSASERNVEPSFRLKLLHETIISDCIHAMTPFLDTLLVPLFGNLVLFGLGKKQLLKKSISATTPSITNITALATWKNERLAVGDNRESVTLFLFDREEYLFKAVADDTVKRHVTVLKFLDESTIIGGDKFSNIWTLRLAMEYEKKIETNFPHALNRLQDVPSLKNKAPNIMECPYKLSLMNHFFINDIPTEIQVLESIQLSDRPAIIYLGLQGTIGCLVPLLSKSEIIQLKKIEDIISSADEKFFFEQEMQNSKKEAADIDDGQGFRTLRTQRQKIPEGAYSIVGRDHSKYRGYYTPRRNVIDGDLCESFLSLSFTEQTFLCKDQQGVEIANIKKRINSVRMNYM
ncbi:hypothetical protein HG535_0G00250 [Zygotorulaspora mrakii]|uniref:Cleavage/polyadenylation specificity factor A subunit N-terminal domain-containing protein n=1 Tax=Zygotorulaspora mrakii TaxID=42260 RepID=A0A7H9B6I4_ZYGMR|nr:uncharacterized protein HG535_0G00250 [Zygotorulaspora mrakii]QLG74140.1 hypothetical protein HG535_0G00250 [Zygotorulaspora mrakii]